MMGDNEDRQPPEGEVPDALKPPEEQDMDDLEEFHEDEDPAPQDDGDDDLPFEAGWGTPDEGHPARSGPAPDDVLGLRFHGDPGPLFAALAKAQHAFPELERTEKTEYKVNKNKPDKPTRKIKYWYVPLKELVQSLRPEMNKQGLSVLQPVSEGPDGRVVRTILAHHTGSMIEATIKLPEHEDPQEMASAVTYMRRYQLASLLGVSAETDDDGERASQASASPSPPPRDENGNGGTVHVTGTSSDDPDKIRETLKDSGFQWDPSEHAWVLEHVGDPDSVAKSMRRKLPDRLTVEVV